MAVAGTLLFSLHVLALDKLSDGVLAPTVEGVNAGSVYCSLSGAEIALIPPLTGVVSKRRPCSLSEAEAAGCAYIGGNGLVLKAE